jgi:hypothetical protein
MQVKYIKDWFTKLSGFDENDDLLETIDEFQSGLLEDLTTIERNFDRVIGFNASNVPKRKH